MTRLLLLFSLQLQACYSQCDGNSPRSITGNGSIESPNFPSEYGQKANCVWETLLAPRYVTTLRIVRLKLVPPPVKKGRTANCKQGAYKLLVNGEQIPSELYIDVKSEQRCYSFLNKCDEKPDISDCLMQNYSGRVKIQYIATGCKEDQAMTENYMWGFKIKHESILCWTTNTVNTNQDNGEPTERISPPVILHSHTTPIKRPTQEKKATSSNIGNSVLPTRSVSAKYPQTATTASQIHSTTTTNQDPPATAEKSNPAAIIGVIVGILFITGAGIAVIYIIRKRQLRERQKSNINEPEGQGHPNRSNGIDVEYAVIDRTSRSEHERATTSLAIDQSGGLIQNTSAEPSTSFAAYAEVDRKAKRQLKECKARLDDEKEMASHASDQSCVESPDSTTIPVYAQVDREARRRAKESRDQSSFPPPTNQAVEAAYSSVIRDACGAKATVHMDY